MVILRLHRGRPDAHHPALRASNWDGNSRRMAGTTLPARWSNQTYAPSVQVSCRQESLSFFTIAANLEMRYGKNFRICTGGTGMGNCASTFGRTVGSQKVYATKKRARGVFRARLPVGG